MKTQGNGQVAKSVLLSSKELRAFCEGDEHQPALAPFFIINLAFLPFSFSGLLLVISLYFFDEFPKALLLKSIEQVLSIL